MTKLDDDQVLMLVVKRNSPHEDQIQQEEPIDNQLQMNDKNLGHHLQCEQEFIFTILDWGSYWRQKKTYLDKYEHQVDDVDSTRNDLILYYSDQWNHVIVFHLDLLSMKNELRWNRAELNEHHSRNIVEYLFLIH